MIITRVEDIELGYTQAFKYTPLSFGSYSNNKIIELCEKQIIDKDIVKVAQYLYKFKCATLDRIFRDLKLDDERKVARKLDGLVRDRIFNSFILVSDNEQFNSSAGLVFYTLDYGAILLLRSLVEDENLENWKATDLFMTGIKVKKALMIIDFYRQLKGAEYFNTYKVYASYGAKLKCKAEFKQGKDVFLVETVCRDDLAEGSDTEITEKLLHYDQLLGTDGWTYYFEELPTLLIVCDSDKAKTTIKNRLEGCKIPQVKYSILDIETV